MPQIVVAAIAGCICVAGAVLGGQLFSRFQSSARIDPEFAASGVGKRAVALGLLSAVAAVQWLPAVGTLSFWVAAVSAGVCGAAYVFGWLTLVARFGRGAGEAGELSLLATLTLTGVLYAAGLLWTTLLVLGGAVLLAVTVLNGFWIYRLR